MIDFEDEVVDNDEMLNSVNEIKIILKENRYGIDSIQDWKKDYPNEIEKSEESLLNCMGENDLKLIKMDFPDKWKYSTEKLAYPYDYFITIFDYEKPVDNLKKENFFSKLNHDYLDDEEIERTKQIFKLSIIKSGKELTEISLKSDVLLLACVFEKIKKV